mmetsp:Transcript_48445/g.75653  ORF Transcript_48445/g.75653 Transcript_48445/m.75653 type:complete len:116 (+) Transcript_48445:427-774(+)
MVVPVGVLMGHNSKASTLPGAPPCRATTTPSTKPAEAASAAASLRVPAPDLILFSSSATQLLSSPTTANGRTTKNQKVQELGSERPRGARAEQYGTFTRGQGLTGWGTKDKGLRG